MAAASASHRRRLLDRPGAPRLVAAVAGLVLGSLTLSIGAASADPVAEPEGPVPSDLSAAGTYIVTLADAPVAAYDGGVAGYDATRPEDGSPVRTTSADARRYRGYLRDRQDTVADRVGATPRTRYEIGLAAFTARLTGQQAATLASTSGVVSVTKDSLRRTPDDRSSADFLGLTGNEGVWSRLGGAGAAGRGVVIGVLDSGIWPESASFAGDRLGSSAGAAFVPYRSGNAITMAKSDGGRFTGTCQSGQEFTADDCSSKIVGARYFGDAWLAGVPEADRRDYVSPRDIDGHGSHVASIAAGNAGVPATVAGRDVGRISGVAPAAKLAIYKVLWEGATAAQTGGYTSDILAAIDAAVTDGVDVINYSVTGADDPTDPVQLAFLAAARAGIFVAASAGNSGPTAGTVQNTAPWVTTVGAHTIAPYAGTVRLGNGAAYAGVSTSVTGTVPRAPLVTGAAVAAAGASPEVAAQCGPGSLDPARTAGTIVVCARGGVERVVKSAEVERAGGVGMVLVNLTENTLDADAHRVPTVHLNPPDAEAVTAYAATAGATATLVEGNRTSTELPYPQIAVSSSRGPSAGTGGDTLKPDLVAPGVSILGAVGAPPSGGADFGFLSGTSQAAPQVSGLAALWLGAGARPTWSPMRIKSALMTTAGAQRDGDGRRLRDPFASGAGRVVPTRMLDAGLVYPAGDEDWLGYLEGLGMATGSGVEAIDPSDYNSPSIAIGALTGTQTVTRRVTALKRGTYRASATMPGVAVRVSPAVLTFSRAGETKTFRVTVTRRGAALDKPVGGSLTWRSGETRVRIPLAVTPVYLEAPAQVTGTGSAGETTFTVTPGVSGRFPVDASGLVTGDPRPGSLRTGQNVMFPVRVPAGAKATQVSVRTPASAANLNLGVYRVVNGQAVLVGRGVSYGAEETVTLTAPAAGDYVGLVLNLASAPGSTETPFTFRAVSVTTGPGTGSFAVSPADASVRAGRPLELTARWSGIEAAVPHLGWIAYPDGSGTAVAVN